MRSAFALLGPNIQSLDKFGRFPVQLLGHFLTQFAPAFGLLFDFLRLQHNPFGFQVRRQELLHRTRGRSGTRQSFHFRRRGHDDALQPQQQQFQLFGAKAFALAPAKVSLDEILQLLP